MPARKSDLLRLSLFHRLAILAAAACAMNSTTAGQFGPQRVITIAANGAYSVHAADLDGDGDQDVLAGSLGSGSATVAWYRNTDSLATFSSAEVISALAGLRSVTATDIDGDSDLDVLCAFGLAGEVAWFENADGLGAFGAGDAIAPTAGYPISAVGADLDGDGDQDVLVGALHEDAVSWYENADALGSFGGAKVIASSLLAGPVWDVLATDLDGDGDQDVLSASENDEVVWYQNTNGKGLFGTPKIITLSAEDPRSVFAGDLDGDGDMDVLSASSADHEIAWYSNIDGAGAFGSQVIITAQAEGAYSAMGVDIDVDGDLDVLTASVTDNKIAWHENTDGLGTFGTQQVITTSALEAESAFASDLDGDGDMDALSASYLDDKVAWYENQMLLDCFPTLLEVAGGEAFAHVGHALATSNGPYVLLGLPDLDLTGFDTGAGVLAYWDGSAWTSLPQIEASDGAAGDLFGDSVSIEGTVALLGARGDSAEAGAAYVFRQQSDGSWAEETKLVGADTQAGDWLGAKVAIFGSIAAVAALHADAPAVESGAVYVFRDGASGWSQEAKIVASDGAAGDQFGKGLAVSGSSILIGAYGDNHIGQDAGSAYIYHQNGGAWTQEAKLIASDPSANALFGNEVALDGDLAVVAARGANGIGAVYVFHRSGTSWTQEQKLVASTPFLNAEFGSSLAFVGDRILVGARNDDGAAPNAGAAFLFEHDGTAWVETMKYTLPGASADDRAGSAVALRGSFVLVGAEWADASATDGGALWAFAAPDQCVPKITAVQGTQAQDPAVVTASGKFLGHTQEVTVGGVSVPLLAASAESITYQPNMDDPGFLTLSASGLEGTADALQQLYPSLVASTTGVGGTLTVTLDNGEAGLYALALALGSLAAPVPISSPPTWYGVLLNPAGPLFVVGTGAFSTSAPAVLAYPVPPNPGLTGLQIYLQAWCQQGFFGPEVTYSFTNMAPVIL